MYSVIVKAVADMFKSFFDWRTCSSENQLEKEVIEDKRDYKKACNYGENAILLAEKSSIFLKKKDKFRFNYYTKKFRKFK